MYNLSANDSFLTAGVLHTEMADIAASANWSIFYKPCIDFVVVCVLWVHNLMQLTRLIHLHNILTIVLL